MDPNDLNPHPQHFLVPQMRPDEYEALLEDITQRDIKTPLEIHGRVILDGFHRWRAAKELGLDNVPTIEASLAEEETTLDYVLKSAVLRRHLSDDQRAMSAAMYARENPGQRGRPVKGHEPDHARVLDIAADIFRVTKRKARRAAEVLKADPNNARLVHSGTMSLMKARQGAKGKGENSSKIQERVTGVEKEREACAQIVEGWRPAGLFEPRELGRITEVLKEVAAAIRARGA